MDIPSLKVDSAKPPLPLATTRRTLGGKQCTFDTLREIEHPVYKLTRLCRDRIGSVTTYYIRMGIRSDGVAAGGVQVNRKWTDIAKHWNDLLDEMPRVPPLDPESKG